MVLTVGLDEVVDQHVVDEMEVVYAEVALLLEVYHAEEVYDPVGLHAEVEVYEVDQHEVVVCVEYIYLTMENKSLLCHNVCCLVNEVNIYFHCRTHEDDIVHG